MIQENAECVGAEVSKGRYLKVDGCSLACKGVSTMFIYGSGPKCNKKGCICWCEINARSNGTCSTSSIQHYNLYKNGNLNKGKILI